MTEEDVSGLDLDRQLASIKAEEDKKEVAERVRAARSRMRVLKSENDFLLFCRTYFAHVCFKEFGPAQIEFAMDLQNLSCTGARIVRAMPREFAKTTITTLNCLWRLGYKKNKYIVYASDSISQASLQVQFMEAELEQNELFREDFGDLVSREKWSKTEFITATGIRVVAKGARTRIRGIKHRQYRPDLLILDDLENDREIPQIQYRDDTERWLKKAALNILSEKGDAIMVGTVLHHDSVLKRVMASPAWKSKAWKARDDNGDPTWAANWSEERLTKKLLEIGSEAFAAEMMNDPVDMANAAFKRRFLRFYAPEDLKMSDGTDRYLHKFGILDPAWSKGRAAHWAAMAVLGVDWENVWWILDLWREKHASELSIGYALLGLQQKHACLSWGIETNFKQTGFKDVVQRLMLEHNCLFPVVDLKSNVSGGGKELRIRNYLVPRWEMGAVRIPKAHPLSPVLVDEILQFPSSQTDDILDAVSYGGQFAYKPASPAERAAERRNRRSFRTVVDPETNYRHTALVGPRSNPQEDEWDD
jgi:phage terminase large subunit-like protein